MKQLVAMCLGLGMVLLAGALSDSVAFAEEAQYVGHNQCQVCHNKPEEGAQWSKWKEMKHAGAYERLKSDEAQEVAKKLGLTTPAVESPECLRCHVTGYDVETKSAPPRIELAHGVQCESCHGPSSLHVVIGRQLMFGQAKKEDVDIMGGRVQPAEETCLQCHNEENPTWRDDRYTLEDGTTVGFDYEQAFAKIDHSNPQKKEEE